MFPLVGFGPISTNPNPCVRVFGPGPEGAKCKTCVHLTYHWSAGTRYYKCRQRKMTMGAATDHRLRWDACGKYEVAS